MADFSREARALGAFDPDVYRRNIGSPGKYTATAGTLGFSWDPRDWFAKETGEFATMPKSLADKLRYNLGVLLTRLLLVNKLLVNKQKAGTAVQSDVQAYNRAAEAYNSLVDSVVSDLRKAKVGYPYKFTKIKTTRMSDWHVWPTWSKSYSVEKGLHGFGAASAAAAAAPLTAGSLVVPVTIVFVGLAALGAVYLGYKTVQMFKETEMVANDAIKHMQESRNELIDDMVASGEITRQEGNQLKIQSYQETLDLAREEGFDFKKILTNLAYIAGIGGIAYVGYRVYESRKKKASA